jgi:phosphomannomutase/phosphomannomutase/phosphoglucomutase
MSRIAISGFKAYDLRGRVPGELNDQVAYRVGRAYADFVQPRKVIVGRDIRLSSEQLAKSLEQGLLDAGVDVYDVGLCGTEVVYYATFANAMDGGIMVTASHNPPDYNGMKFVREGSRPISGDTGLQDIRSLAEAGEFTKATRTGERYAIDPMPGYLEHLLSYIDRARLKPLKIVVHAGNGGAGLIVDKLEPFLPFEFVKVDHEPDGRFPNGVPNPMLPENHRAPVEALRRHRADLAISWDGDYDRCFLFDENGTFIEGYYIVGLLASVFLARKPGSAIVHDPRLTWNTLDIVRAGHGRAVLSKSGHAFIKQVMREADAIYGGEMSAHHYFREFSYCDSGMIPWLLVAQIISETGQTLSELVGQRMRLFPASGEINRRVPDSQATLSTVRDRYVPGALSVDTTDGLSVEYAEWRFNLRVSNTEPLIRLNVESRGQPDLMRARTAELLQVIGGEPG